MQEHKALRVQVVKVLRRLLLGNWAIWTLRCCFTENEAEDLVSESTKTLDMSQNDQEQYFPLIFFFN